MKSRHSNRVAHGLLNCTLTFSSRASIVVVRPSFRTLSPAGPAGHTAEDEWAKAHHENGQRDDHSVNRRGSFDGGSRELLEIHLTLSVTALVYPGLLTFQRGVGACIGSHSGANLPVRYQEEESNEEGNNEQEPLECAKHDSPPIATHAGKNENRE